MDYFIGQRLKRITRGNLAPELYKKIKDKIFIVTSITPNYLYFKAEDGSRLSFSDYTKVYADKVLGVAPAIQIGGE